MKKGPDWKDQTNNKFKVGDRVQYIGNNGACYIISGQASYGNLGTIKRIIGIRHEVKFDVTHGNSTESCLENEIKLHKPNILSEAIGDIVRLFDGETKKAYHDAHVKKSRRNMERLWFVHIQNDAWKKCVELMLKHREKFEKIPPNDEKIEIEVCERSKDDGKGGRSLFLKQHTAAYHAQIASVPGFWGCGNSPDEAIGNLIKTHPEMFGLEL